MELSAQERRTAAGGREICSRCFKPLHATCICSALPEHPIQLLKSRLLVLEHPHERKHKNRSLPFLQHCIQPMDVIVGKSFVRISEQDETIRTILHAPSSTTHVWLLFPHPEAVPLSQAISTVLLKEDSTKQRQQRVVHLVLLDATWTYSKNMDDKNTKHRLYPPQMLRVQLDDQDLLPRTRRFHIRTPPSDAHLSTAECAAWALSKIEGNPQIYDTVVRPMDLMVKQWETFMRRRENE